MPCEFQRDVLKLVRQVLGGSCEPTPKWLLRPGHVECGERLQLICEIYRELTNQKLPQTMPRRESRRVDCVLKAANSNPRIIEVDETQHFNRFRAETLRLYPPEIELAFDRKVWAERSEAKKKLEGGGFTMTNSPPFPWRQRTPPTKSVSRRPLRHSSTRSRLLANASDCQIRC